MAARHILDSATDYIKRFVCLANSYKAPLGRCIAGKEITDAGGPGPWIRPISARPKGELSSSEYGYADGGRPGLLDIVHAAFEREFQQIPQTENHIVAPARRWQKTAALSWHDLEKFLDHPDCLWTNSDHTYEGHNDCMSAAEAARLQGSLLLIKADEFTVEAINSRFHEKRTYRGRFFYRRKYYNFSVTDPAIHEQFASQPEGDYGLGEVYLSLSLTLPFEIDNRCHKLVAAVIAPAVEAKPPGTARRL